ncbi:hypothetical protein H0241_11005 [Mesorhizobium sp. CCANP35]|uniref:Uncharacterized protein n=1 Tax=Mesorhizobium neociceri TaxID=1307853 RepID=A0A838B448_9HYPH|nr:hypothetical protein [Mesorhizobium neociceri]
MGGRLLAMVNAKALADATGHRFGFTWKRAVSDKTFHIVDTVDNIFNPDFIEKHWLGEKIRETNLAVLKKNKFTRASLNASARRSYFRGWLCNDFNVLESFRDNGKPLATSETIRTIGFAESVQHALRTAESCHFPGQMVGLHLRSGDIVRGKYRSMLNFNGKVIPSTLAKAIIAELASQGMATLLVGQDRATLDYLRSQTGALLTDDFGANEFEDQTLRAFFEMALLARCQRIYAGSSVFASVASVMGGSPHIKATKLFSPPRAAQLMLGELAQNHADYHPREAAFGYLSAFLAIEDEISPVRAREILGKGYALDPENDVYALKIVASYFREKDYAAGEAILKSRMTAQFEARPKVPLPMLLALSRKTVHGHAMGKDFASYFAAARAGHPYATACSAHILHDGFGELKPALEMIARSQAAEPANALFRTIRRYIRPIATRESSPLLKARLRLWKAGIRI